MLKGSLFQEQVPGIQQGQISFECVPFLAAADCQKKLGGLTADCGIPYTAHGAQPPPLFLFLCLFMVRFVPQGLERGLVRAPQG